MAMMKCTTICRGKVLLLLLVWTLVLAGRDFGNCFFKSNIGTAKFYTKSRRVLMGKEYFTSSSESSQRLMSMIDLTLDYSDSTSDASQAISPSALLPGGGSSLENHPPYTAPQVLPPAIPHISPSFSSIRFQSPQQPLRSPMMSPSIGLGSPGPLMQIGGPNAPPGSAPGVLSKVPSSGMTSISTPGISPSFFETSPSPMSPPFLASAPVVASPSPAIEFRKAEGPVLEAPKIAAPRIYAPIVESPASPQTPALTPRAGSTTGRVPPEAPTPLAQSISIPSPSPIERTLHRGAPHAPEAGTTAPSPNVLAPTPVAKTGGSPLEGARPSHSEPPIAKPPGSDHVTISPSIAPSQGISPISSPSSPIVSPLSPSISSPSPIISPLAPSITSSPLNGSPLSPSISASSPNVSPLSPSISPSISPSQWSVPSSSMSPSAAPVQFSSSAPGQAAQSPIFAPTGSPFSPRPFSPHPSSTLAPDVINSPFPAAPAPILESPLASPAHGPVPATSQIRSPAGSPSISTVPNSGHAPAGSPHVANPPTAVPTAGPIQWTVPAVAPVVSGGITPARSPIHHQPTPAPAPTGRNHGASQLPAPVSGPGTAPSPYQILAPKAAPPSLFFLPPPPPNTGCRQTCVSPYISTPPGSPCGCVIPIQVGLELGVALYTLFPLVSELAEELAAGTYLSQSQVRIMGANAVSDDLDKTVVKSDLVPLGQSFDNTTAVIIAQRFWDHQVTINQTLFGNYSVLYVEYPGLPPSPPSQGSPGSIAGQPAGSAAGGTAEPFGVVIHKRRSKLGAGVIALIALLCAIGVVVGLGFVWLIVIKCSRQKKPVVAADPTIASSMTKRSGGPSVLSSSVPSSTSLSFASSFATYTGSAKTFSLAELEKATDKFKPQNVIGEGGFGRVYRGTLEDQTKVAIKVLTRDDQQGGREFVAEVEMLSRLHHRNLVKLIGICTEGRTHCLVYELIHNGSVESHLHGADKETSPLDWEARLKIALGAARGLAYLHEDSNPRVIHRDFKASNILLEEDFTPKVSDFGLAKAASEEISGHISTRVMGTFGYVAPEYAMTGHLLVKSDVYSYGVVLLELLSGRKPVDMSQPPGQENLVTWARPLLTSKEGLESLVDPALGNKFPFDNLARVAAIASMCVQPEVSHRPFMGEVVQALKLVYNDSDASDGIMSGNASMAGESPADCNENVTQQTWDSRSRFAPDSASFMSIDYDSGTLSSMAGRPTSNSAVIKKQQSGSFRRQNASGPLRTKKSKLLWFMSRHRAGGSISDHGIEQYKSTKTGGFFSDIWS